jgi:hypothetical protein
MLVPLLAVAALGFLVGGVIVLIDSVILRRVRRQKIDREDDR